MQGSLGASAVNAAAMQWGRRKGYFDLPAAFVAPSRVMVDKMVAGGMPAGKLHHLPTFVRAREPRPFAQRARRVCYVGRIERIKGLVTLFDAWEMLHRDGMRDVELVVAGDLDTPCGRSLEQRLKERPIPGVTFAGQLDEAGVVELLQSSQLSVVPSCGTRTPPTRCSRASPAARPWSPRSWARCAR